MRFFTNPYGAYPYHLIPYRIWRSGYNKEYKELIIDCGVNDLVGKKDYIYINEYPLAIIQENIKWVIPDYPYDVGPDLDRRTCIAKTLENIKKWHELPNSICSVQYYFENIKSFKYYYKIIYEYASDVIGIGNLCKSTKMTFLKQVINFIINNNLENKQIHFFGLCKLAIKYLISKCPSFRYSVDSMKWDYGMHCDRSGDKNAKDARWYRGLEYINELNNYYNFYKNIRNIKEWI